MPWHVAKHDSCPTDKPWAVIKDADGKVVACHASQGDARKQMAALYVNVPESSVPVAATVVEASSKLMPVTPPSQAPGSRWRARLIEGNVWGRCGFYPAEVLEADGPTTWPEGTQIYFDHPGESEMFDRPERSVRDLAGRISSTPVYEGDGLYSNVEFYSWAAPIVAEMAADIGLSVRAGGMLEQGEAYGRRGTVVTSLREGLSVDLVTKAAAGGKLVALLESARHPQGAEEAPPRAQAASHGVEEAWDGAGAMSKAANSDSPASAYRAICAGRKAGDPEKQSSWALPHHATPGGPPDPDGVRNALARLSQTQGLTNTEAARKHLQAHLAEINRGSQSESHHHQPQEGAMPDPVEETAASAAPETSSGPPAEPATTEPVVAPVAEATTPPAAEAANPSQEETMSQPTGAGATAPPTNPRQVMEAQVATMRREVAELRAQNRARDVVAEVLASGWIGEAQRARLTGALVQGVPLTGAGELDEPALRTRVQEALDTAETEAAEILQAAGVGTPRGLGGLASPATEAASTAATAKLEESFKALGLTEAATQIAVKGR